MVKGIARRVVVIKSPDPRIFDEAIFIVKDDAGKRGVTTDEILREAQDAAMNYVRTVRGRSGLWRKLPPAAWAGVGAAGTGLLWLAAALLF